MKADEIEQALRDLATRGTCIKRHPTRQVWHIDIAGKPLIVKFYPHRPNRWRSLVRGSLAMHEFTRLQWLQKARIPAPRAIAALMGFVLEGVKGDAVVMEAIEPAERLDLAINRHALEGRPLPHHREIARQLVDIVSSLQRSGLSHRDLHLGNFLLAPPAIGGDGAGVLWLIDAYPLRRREMPRRDLFKLALSVRGVATRTDLLRAWRRLAPGEALPLYNPLLPAHWRKLQSRIFRENAYFGRLQQGEWAGPFFRHAKYPRRFSPASHLDISLQHWQEAWPQLLQGIEAGRFQVLKDSPSASVLAGDLELGGQRVSVVIKRPRRKKLIRFISDIGRGARARRAWRRSWSLLHRDLPTAWPLLLMERRVLGYVVDQLIVYERVAGEPLSRTQFDALTDAQRLALFHRAGATLRHLEESGLYHWDAKSSNWMILPDPKLGPCPIMIDVDGIRSNWGIAEGMRRLLQTMREHRQYTPLDSLHLCRGYAPFSPIHQDEPEEQSPGDSPAEAG